MMAELWDDIDQDIASARRHFTNAVSLFRSKGFASGSPPDEVDEMAFLHMMQSGDTSFEAGLKRILLLIGEELPLGSQSGADLLRRFRSAMAGSRPALLDERLFRAATESRKSRHVAMHVDDDLDHERAALVVRDAETVLAGIEPALARFRAAIDPD